MIIKDKTVNENKIDIQLLQVKSPYGACKATNSKFIVSVYAVLIGSIAKVNGFNEANHPSQFGMKEIGAKAVLAKRRGKFITNIRAINSICPGKTNAKHKLIDVTKRTNRISVVKTIPKPYKLGHP